MSTQKEQLVTQERSTHPYCNALYSKDAQIHFSKWFSCSHIFTSKFLLPDVNWLLAAIRWFLQVIWNLNTRSKTKWTSRGNFFWSKTGRTVLFLICPVLITYFDVTGTKPINGIGQTGPYPWPTHQTPLPNPLRIIWPLNH